MSTLTINADLKYIEFILGTIGQANDEITICDIKKFKIAFKTEIPVLLNQNFGILRLVPLLLFDRILRTVK